MALPLSIYMRRRRRSSATGLLVLLAADIAALDCTVSPDNPSSSLSKEQQETLRRIMHARSPTTNTLSSSPDVSNRPCNLGVILYHDVEKCALVSCEVIPIVVSRNLRLYQARGKYSSRNHLTTWTLSYESRLLDDLDPDVLGILFLSFSTNITWTTADFEIYLKRLSHPLAVSVRGPEEYNEVRWVSDVLHGLQGDCVVSLPCTIYDLLGYGRLRNDLGKAVRSERGVPILYL
ncbi:hypothetical protein BDQ12DRAFT_724840 [Crucibulum laeve]|uniref:Uncharacterized protein n=1 Tax=Crucibulum laeve TaxID=68775 RepID=A0A5C3LUK6_9AGAR|nr:hypothetical protein BDQ12DRAFT_724840 [Crucibulum laeve]